MRAVTDGMLRLSTEMRVMIITGMKMNVVVTKRTVKIVLKVKV
jgi:hypothetical protein